MNYRDIPQCNNEKVPQPQTELRHVLEIQSRFNDYDGFGHVNNSVYFQLMDLGKVAFFEQALGHKLDSAQPGAVIVNVNASFYAPAMFGEPLVVCSGCVGVSKRSFTLEQRVVNPLTGSVKCVGITVMASFDPATMTSPELSPEWVAALTAVPGRRG